MVYILLMENDIRLTLRLPKEVHDWLVKLAAEESRSLNGEIVHLLRQNMLPAPKKKSPTRDG